MYKKLCTKLPNDTIQENEQVVRLSDGAIIPIDELNMDYQKYLEWLSEGNTPEECDEKK